MKGYDVVFIAFNSGRWYSEKGQRIAAAQVEDKLYFIDKDRGLDGVFIVEPGSPLTQEKVMRLYDAGGYGMNFDRWGKHAAIDAILSNALNNL